MARIATTRAERRKVGQPAKSPGKTRSSRKGPGEHKSQRQIPRKGASRPRPRAERQAQRREAILAAALEEFSARGFAATRLDDIARRAGVAKGTIYLYFRDKESLFQELVRAMLSPIVGRLEAAPMADLPPRMVAEAIADVFVHEIFATRRQDVIRLIITEGHRFPKLAEVYYHEVIGRVVPVVRGLMARAAARGELPNDALARFPQLLVAPALVALIWNGLFSRFAPLDVGELLRAHIAVLFGERSAT
jgi:AcrR family transcriptional regulator